MHGREMPLIPMSEWTTENWLQEDAFVGPPFVSEVMTPIVFTVRGDDSARKVVEQMVSLNIHRLFVVDEVGVVVGVISALDVLRRLVWPNLLTPFALGKGPGRQVYLTSPTSSPGSCRRRKR